MVPFVAGRNRVSRLKQVVLPAPLGPISAWMVPRRIRRSTRLTATKPRNSFESPRVSRITSGVSGTLRLRPHFRDCFKAVSASAEAARNCTAPKPRSAAGAACKPAPRASAGAALPCDPGAGSPASSALREAHMRTGFALLAACLLGSGAYAQYTNPDNPHDTKSKDRQTANTPQSVTNPQVEATEPGNPTHTHATE